jgi:aerobic-type carbon monoxide dehydrogenase small subunit (CoxS/CutS family)
MKKQITVIVNGTAETRDVPLRMLLVDFVRDVLELTGTHQGCTYEGVCGACTLHLDGEAIKSCMMLAVQADGKEITTIEGIARNGELHAVQKAFREHHGLQCGFCTSGMIMNAIEFLRVNPDPSEDQIRHALIGNICRCTGYQNIVKAVSAAAAELREASA